MFPLLKLTEAEILERITHASVGDVRSVLAQEEPGFYGLLALLSPAAAQLLPELCAEAERKRLERFGRTVGVYAPLYVANGCINACKYCDFSSKHHTERRTLTQEEIRREGEAVRALGIDSLLIVAGEDPKHVTTAYLCEVAHTLRDLFSCLSLEVAPQSEATYRELFHAGYESLTCFQETYDATLYADLHPLGPKHNYDWRLWTQLRAGKAGFRTLGMAFLMGLRDWRSEAASLAAHAFYLMKECWQAKIQFAFPRIRPVEGGFIPPNPVDDDTLEQIMLAFRIAFPAAGITVSTREAPAFRDRIIRTCADNMSAGSRVTPGGYAVDVREETAQFSLSDTRPAEAVFQAITREGYEVVRKQWDPRMD